MTDNELFGNSKQLESSHFADPGNMVGDTISRQAAITLFEKYGATEDAIALLESLPPAQPTDEEIQRMQDIEQAMLEKAYWFGKRDAQQWIPVTPKTLPKKVGDYLVTTHSGQIARYIYMGNGTSKEYWMRCVLAWMPLPEPYRPEGDKKHEG